MEISRYKLQKLHTRPQDLTSREFFLYQKCVWPRHSGVRFKSEVEFTYVLSRSRFHVFLFLVENFLFCEKNEWRFCNLQKNLQVRFWNLLEAWHTLTAVVRGRHRIGLAGSSSAGVLG